ncbi:MAG: glycosyltransferase family 9 protein [Bdellovibrionales bacterium]
MKVLIIRFSSFGDVLQTLSVAGRIGQSWPEAEIHWASRTEFVPLIESHPRISKVWSLNKGAGLAELVRLGSQLRAQGFTHVYDAHNSLRSRILGWQLCGGLGWRCWFGRLKFLRRSIFRWRRFLLFRFRINRFPKPFSGQRALLEPLAKWGLPIEAPPVPQLFLPSVDLKSRIGRGPYIALAPSAAFPLKRWPVEKWQELIRSEERHRFVILGGPEDSFLKELELDPMRVVNLAGQLSLMESAVVVSQAQALVSNDTGLMHVAEQVGVPCVALMGPAPFGFPSRPKTKILQKDLTCRPCSKHGQGPCVNPNFQQCLRDITVKEVRQELECLIHA